MVEEDLALMSSGSSLFPEHEAEQLAKHVYLVTKQYARLVSMDDQADIAQDALLALVRELKSGSAVDDRRLWIVGVVRHTYASRLRTLASRARHRSLSGETDDDDGGTSAGDPAARRDAWADLDHFLNDVFPSLSEREKIILRDFASGETRRSMAARRRVPVHAIQAEVKSLLKRIRFFVLRNDRTSGADY